MGSLPPSVGTSTPEHKRGPRAPRRSFSVSRSPTWPRTISDPLSLLSRLAASVPAETSRHTVRYAGVLASASKLRPRIVPKPPAVEVAEDAGESSKPKRAGCRYRSWAELLRTLGIDAFACPNCQGRMRILALVRDPDEVANIRFLQALGEPTAPPKRAPARGPPY